MNHIEKLFNKYHPSGFNDDDFEDYVYHEVNEEGEVITLELFDSEYDAFPFVNKIGEFIGEFKHLKHLEIDVYDSIFPLNNLQALSDLTALQTISIDCNTEIKDLSFAQNMSNLTSISLFSSAISDLQPLSDKYQLMSISLPNAHIRDISPLRHLSNLTFINFNNNQIDNIDALLHCQKLQSIHADNNQIRSVSVLQNLYDLTTISLSNNQLSNLNDLRYLNKITSLTVNDNQISSIDFLEQLTNITRLFLHNNRISDIDYLKNCPQLRTLNISNNSVGGIAILTGLQDLKELYISNNPIRSIEALQDLPALHTLNASHLGLFINDNFQLKSQLVEADFSHCNLHNIDFLSNQKKLQQLNLSHNQISDINQLKGFNDLLNLKLQSNHIHEVIDIKQFVRLQLIDLRGNSFGNKIFNSTIAPQHSTADNSEEILPAAEAVSMIYLQKLVATAFLQKGDREAALAYYYFDKYSQRQFVRSQFDVRLYLLKQLSKRDSPFVYHLQLKLLKTLDNQFAYTQEELKSKANYLDIILNIKSRFVEKPKTTERLPYYFSNFNGFEDMFLPTLQQLFAEEQEIMKGVFVNPRPNKPKYYQRKTKSDNDTALIVVVTIAIVVLVGISAAAVGTGSVVFIMAIIKLLFYFINKD